MIISRVECHETGMGRDLYRKDLATEDFLPASVLTLDHGVFGFPIYIMATMGLAIYLALHSR